MPAQGAIRSGRNNRQASSISRPNGGTTGAVAMTGASATSDPNMIDSAGSASRAAGGIS